MGRKVHRVPVHLDSKGIEPLSEPEIALILRGADELIGSGGPAAPAGKCASEYTAS